MKDHLKCLIKAYRVSAKALYDRSAETYEGLRTGRLPQEDALVYSVYEDFTEASTLKNCAEAIENILIQHGGKDEKKPR